MQSHTPATLASTRQGSRRATEQTTTLCYLPAKCKASAIADAVKAGREGPKVSSKEKWPDHPRRLLSPAGSVTKTLALTNRTQLICMRCQHGHQLLLSSLHSSFAWCRLIAVSHNRTVHTLRRVSCHDPVWAMQLTSAIYPYSPLQHSKMKCR